MSSVFWEIDMEKLCLVNLGCKVNQYELDSLYNSLKDTYEIVPPLSFADLYIVNTCAVTSEAERKSRQYIAKIVKLNPNARIIVMGCASQHDKDKFLTYKNVTAVLGNAGKGDVCRNLNKSGDLSSPLPLEYEDVFFATNVRTRGYVKIQDGCNSFCSYCLIPYIRGRSRSRKLESIVKEATALSKTCQEIVLTGINVSDYRIDGNLALKDVLLALKDLPCRVRMSSFEVNIIDTDFLVAISQMKNFCPHFHLSLQSGSDKVLHDMNRHYNKQQFLDKVRLIREYFEGPAITTDLIVGYPTETEECFEETLDFLKEVRFANVHFFAYSKRDGTRASLLPQINGSVIKERENRLKQVVQELKTNYLKENLTKPMQILIEENDGKESCGFSANYIKCYVEGVFEEGVIVTALPVKLYKEGLLCKII